MVEIKIMYDKFINEKQAVDSKKLRSIKPKYMNINSRVMQNPINLLQRHINISQI